MDEIDQGIRTCRSELYYCLSEKQKVKFAKQAYNRKPFVFENVKNFDILNYKIAVQSRLPPLKVEVNLTMGDIQIYCSCTEENPSRYNAEMVINYEH